MKKLRKKSPLKNSTKKLLRKAQNLCEREMKLAVHRRDKKCQICGSIQRLQCDHWLSRRNKSTYYDLANLTLLCSKCHYLKSYGYQDMTQRVEDEVLLREGEQVCQEIRMRARTIKKWEIQELNDLAETYSRLFL